MNETERLNILWTNADPVTSEKMVMMYGINSKLQGWWKEVTIIIWGATTKLAAENQSIQDQIALTMQEGVQFLACKSCADQLGATDKLLEMGVEVKYMGEHLTQLLKENAKLLTV